MRKLQKGEQSLRVTNEGDADEAIGTLPLVLKGCFILYLYDVNYVPNIT